ncbi:hypothetical protein BN1058_02568 [Paraliobacillus sp. PM-2]|uniref:DUF378 domain-containing protein n=1 Tax=Paraliobacillus sp. PM-2 TaxID=1462524 RepID=UPI00061C55AF|nr:DUF378 domain-containing protein [Paraliobacillus sp. PM-2]CQR48215.1 hypothetical protein BN1058_02568 [Paraliobacillus sp. PM-2]
MNAIQRITLLLVIVGAINWGLIGLFQFDLVAAIFGGGEQSGAFARIIFTLVGISGLVCISLLFKPAEEMASNRTPQPEK